MRSSLLIFLIFFCVTFSAGLASAAEITAKDIVLSLGEEKSVEVWLSDVPAGLAGFIITPVLQGEIIADISFIPSWQFELASVDPDTQTASALDLYSVMTSDSHSFLLGTLNIIGSATGESVLHFEITEMTDHNGDEIVVTQNGIAIQIIGDEKSASRIGIDAKS